MDLMIIQNEWLCWDLQFQIRMSSLIQVETLKRMSRPLHLEIVLMVVLQLVIFVVMGTAVMVVVVRYARGHALVNAKGVLDNLREATVMDSKWAAAVDAVADATEHVDQYVNPVVVDVKLNVQVRAPTIRRLLQPHVDVDLIVVPHALQDVQKHARIYVKGHVVLTVVVHVEMNAPNRVETCVASHVVLTVVGIVLIDAQRRVQLCARVPRNQRRHALDVRLNVQKDVVQDVPVVALIVPVNALRHVEAVVAHAVGHVVQDVQETVVEDVMDTAAVGALERALVQAI